MQAAILPVKSLDRAKARLSSEFDEDIRREIARALLDDALELAINSSFVTWFVVTDDPSVANDARSRGLDVVMDAGEGLNEALAPALRAVTDVGAEAAVVVPSDVPLAEPGDVRDLIDTGDTSEVVVVPSHRDGGTNGLYLRPPSILEPTFGPASLRRHIENAGSQGLRCSILALDRLSLDLDTPEDVDELLAHDAAAGKTVEVLRRLRSGV